MGHWRPLSKVLLLCVVLSAAAWLLVCGLFSGAHNDPEPALSIGSHGDDPGQFEQPRGIAGLPDGSFIVVDRAARVQHFSASGKILHAWRMKQCDWGKPKGLCALPNGNILVCDTHYGRLLVMTVEGEIVEQWGQFGSGPGEFSNPLSAVADAKRGVVYVVEYCGSDRVQKWSLSGKYLASWGRFGCEPGELRRPSGIALDSDGNVHVADAANHRIQKFDPDGKLLKVYGGEGFEPGQLRFPYDIACGPDQRVYVAEFNNHRISVFDSAGNFVRVIGAQGTAPGEFANPWSLAVDANGRLLVSDTGNHRVQIIAVSEAVALAKAPSSEGQ